jgi:hypothetical protein
VCACHSTCFWRARCCCRRWVRAWWVPEQCACVGRTSTCSTTTTVCHSARPCLAHPCVCECMGQSRVVGMRASGLSRHTRCRVELTPPTALRGRPACQSGCGSRWRRGGRRPGACAGTKRPAAQLAVVGDARGGAAAAPAGRPGRGAARRAAGAGAAGAGACSIGLG